MKHYRQLVFDFETDNLFCLAQSGNREALSLLVERNKGLVFDTLKRRRLKDTDENIQNGLLGLVTAVQRYDPMKGAFSTYASFWIFQSIARGDYIKHSERMAKKVSLDALHDRIEYEPVSPYEAQNEREAKDLIEVAMSKAHLSRQERRAIQLYYWQDKNLEQTGQAMNRTRECARQNIARALAKIKRAYEMAARFP